VPEIESGSAAKTKNKKKLSKKEAPALPFLTWLAICEKIEVWIQPATQEKQ